MHELSAFGYLLKDQKRARDERSAALSKPKSTPARRATATRDLVTKTDFAHLIQRGDVLRGAGPEAQSEPAVPGAPFAERMLAAVATVQGKTFDRSQMANGPAQHTQKVSGADIMAAVRAAHPSRHGET